MLIYAYNISSCVVIRDIYYIYIYINSEIKGEKEIDSERKREIVR